MNVEDFEKGKLIKEALKIVDELAKSDLGDIDGEFDYSDFEYDLLQKLIIKARKLKQNRFWKL
ncbi:MAG: hypothetical protein ACOC22_00175 [bacterium]